MDIYDLADCQEEEGGAETLEKFEKLIEDLYCTQENSVEYFMAKVIMNLANRTDQEPLSVMQNVVAALSDESIYYAHVLLHDSQGTRIAGDLPLNMKLIIESREKEYK